MISNSDKPAGSKQVKSRLSIGGIQIFGPVTDQQSRCVHYNSPLDIISIKFRCCGKYYPCHSCHNETEDHPAQQWEKEARDQKAILCGVCANELSISEYFLCGNQCPHAQASFNPGCSKHYSLY